MGKFFEAARSRIRMINWDYEDVYRPSHELLLKEYIRRGNQFLDFINKNPDRRIAVFSASDAIDANLPIDIEEYCTELNEIYGTAYSVCTFYLEWAYLLDQEEPVALKFYDLYEPIIKLYERGGRISYRENFLMCGSSEWPRNSARILRDIPPIDIQDEALEKFDREWFKEKITNEVMKYDAGGQRVEKLVTYILERLRDYSHTSSKEIMIKVELARWLMKHGNRAVHYLGEIQKELMEFTIDKNLEKWLPEEEKKNLASNIKQTLEDPKRLNLET